MTFDEACKAAKLRAPVIVVGPTAHKIGSIVFQRISNVTREYDRRGRLSETVGVVDPGSERSICYCPIADVALAPNCPDILKKLISEA